MSVRTRDSLTHSTLIDSVSSVDLRVRDIDRAIGFYSDVVGLRVHDRARTSASLGTSADVILRLDSTGVEAPADPRATGLFHNAFLFPDRGSLGDALVRLAAAGYQVAAGDHLVSEALYIDDPDGNGVELCRDRPEAEWPAPTADMIVPMATLPVDLQAVLEAGRGRDAEGDEAPPETHVGHVHLQVADIGDTTRFYADVLGLDLMATLAGSAAFLSSNGYHHHVGANTWRSRHGRPSLRTKAGLERITFRVNNEDDLPTLAAKLHSRGHHMDQEEGAVSLKDPDGIDLVFSPA
ncbi:MAG: VOC family protein [Actinobacteria bacterium]|nr:VOC family protein [Actinomycetota bacterium]